MNWSCPILRRRGTIAHRRISGREFLPVQRRTSDDAPSQRSAFRALSAKFMSIIAGIFLGFVLWFLVRYLVAGLYTVDQNERAVKTSFGRAERMGDATTLDDPISETLAAEERERYCYPQVRVVPPGRSRISNGRGRKCTRSTWPRRPSSMAFDPEDPQANDERHAAQRGDQGPTRHRPHRPDSLPRLGAKSLRLPLRREAARSSTSWVTSSASCANGSPTSRRRRKSR